MSKTYRRTKEDYHKANRDKSFKKSKEEKRNKYKKSKIQDEGEE